MIRYGINIFGGIIGFIDFINEYKPNIHAAQICLGDPKKHILTNKFDNEELNENLKSVLIDNDIKLFVHGPYVLSPSKSPGMAYKSVKNHIDICSKLGVEYCTFHSGSWKSPCPDTVKTWVSIAESVSEYSAKILLENMPYKEGAVNAYQLNEICDKSSIRITFDTAHDWVGSVDMNEINPEYVELVHFNNTNEHRWSGKDRHSDNHADRGLIDLSCVSERFTNACFVSEFGGDPKDLLDEVSLISAYLD